MPTSPRAAAALLIAASAALLAGALAFQYLGGLAPCVLCWWQRYAHGAVIVAAATAFVLPPRLAPLAVAAAGAALLVSAGIAFFHTGVELHWWPGTAACGANFGPSGSIEELRARLMAQPIARCDEVPWSLFGISMAGYNFALSLLLALFAAFAARQHLLSGRSP